MKDDRLYLIHIRDSIARINEYTKEGKEVFFTSNLIQDAVMRNLQTLAECSHRLSTDLRKQYPKIDWRGMRGFRNILVHEYMGIDLDRVWNIVKRDLPRLERMLSSLFERLEPPSATPRKSKVLSRSRARKKKK